MYNSNNSIKISINPSNLVAPVRVNEKFISIDNKPKKAKLSTFDNEEYNYRSDELINSSYKNVDRTQKKYKSQYVFEDDNAYEEKSIITNLLPRIFYRKYGKNYDN